MCPQYPEHPVEAVYNVHAMLSSITDMLGTGDNPVEREGLFTLLLSLESRLRPAVEQLQNYEPRK